jgi:hypothetical protein
MKRSGLPKYVTEFRDRHGKRRLRARRRGDTYYFVAAKGTTDFLLEYQRWLAGKCKHPGRACERQLPVACRR